MAPKPTLGRKFMLLEDLPNAPDRIFRVTFSTDLNEYDAVRDRISSHCEILKEEVEDV